MPGRITQLISGRRPLDQTAAACCTKPARARRADRERRVLRGLYDRTMSLAGHRHALWVLAAVSFVESSVFPIPPDVLMIPMVLAAPHRAFLIAGVCTLASVLGGVAGYGIGYFFYEQIGAPVLESLGKTDSMAEFNQRFNDVGFWAVLVAGLTPFPYKVITIMSGWTAMPMATFVVTSILARGLRFFIVAWLLWKFGAPIRDFIERRLGLMFTAFVALLIGGFLVLRVL
jgi:membrane protein YqaA with SNARE-associated domain